MQRIEIGRTKKIVSKSIICQCIKCKEMYINGVNLLLVVVGN